MSSNATPVLALFGASARTGRCVITQAVARGISLQAQIRSQARQEVDPQFVRKVVGNPGDADVIGQMLEKASAVAIVFGPTSPHVDVFCAEATTRILDGMRQRGIRRVVCVTGAMVGDYPQNQTLPLRQVSGLYRRRVPQVAADRVEQEQVIRQSGLDWTILKPPRLTDDAASRSVHVGTQVRAGLLSKVSRTDVAELILEEVVHPRHIRETLFLVS